MKIRDLTAVILRLYALQLFFNCVPSIYRFPMHWNYKFAQDDVMRKYMLADDAITVAPLYAGWSPSSVICRKSHRVGGRKGRRRNHTS